jgi:hypothetical protein
MNLKFCCLDGCKWRCDFDHEDEVYCHGIGRDLSKEEVGILKLVGCALRRPKEHGDKCL